MASDSKVKMIADELVRFGRQAKQGATFGFSDEIQDVLGAGIASALSDMSYQDALSLARELSKNQLSEDWEESPWVSAAGQIAGALPSGIAAGAKLAPQLLMGAAHGVGSAEDDVSDRAMGGAIGVALGAGSAMVPAAATRVARGASDMIDPAVQKTAEVLKNYGVQPRLSQLVDSKFVSAVDSALSKVPFSGANASQASQRQDFTRAMSRTFGEDAGTITPEILEQARNRLGGAYDQILDGVNIPIDRQVFASDLGDILRDLSMQTDQSGVEFLTKQANNILDTLDRGGGSISGDAYQKLRRTLKGARGTNYSVGELQNLLDSAVRQNAPNDIGQALSSVDSQYRNMKIAEKMYGQLQNASGEFRPETLYNAAKPNISNLAYGGGGELGDLARAGRQLRPTIPDSGTATQAAGMGALGAAGVGAFIDPSIAAGTLGTIGMARGLNSAMTSDYLQQGMNPAIQAAADAFSSSGISPAIGRAVIGNMATPSQESLLRNQNNDRFAEMDRIIQGTAQQGESSKFDEMDRLLGIR